MNHFSTTLRVDRPTTLADVLRRLESVRGELALRMRGDAGAFTGFTRLVTHPEAICTCRGPIEIAIWATATRDTARFTEVDLRASVVRITPAGTDMRTVVAGAGVTIYPWSPVVRRDAPVSANSTMVAGIT